MLLGFLGVLDFLVVKIIVLQLSNLIYKVNMESILLIFRGSTKAPPTYSYLSPNLAIIFVVTKHLVSHCSFGATIVNTHLQY